MCIYIHKYNMLSMTNAAYMYGFRAGHLYWITSELIPWKTFIPIIIIPLLPLILWIWLRLPKLFPIQFVMSVVFVQLMLKQP